MGYMSTASRWLIPAPDPPIEPSDRLPSVSSALLLGSCPAVCTAINIIHHYVKNLRREVASQHARRSAGNSFDRRGGYAVPDVVANTCPRRLPRCIATLAGQCTTPQKRFRRKTAKPCTGSRMQECFRLPRRSEASIASKR